MGSSEVSNNQVAVVCNNSDLWCRVNEMDASTWIALASFAVSLFVLWRQHRTAGRAHFTAEWETHDSLVFTNHGPGAATNLSGTVQGGRLSETIEAQYMGPFQGLRVSVSRGIDDPPPGPLDLTWRDNRIRPQHRSITLPVPPSVPQQRTSHNEIEKAVRAVAVEEVRREIDQVARRADLFRRGG
jgi:hypothetical protein